jgi:predicted transcriptional regulator
MDTRLGYIGGGISLVLSLFPENNWIKASFAAVGILSFLFAYILHNKNSSTKEKTNINKKISVKQKPLELSSEHISILKVFRSNDGELTSVPLIKFHTNLETIVINSILDDFEKHNLINATNLDEVNGGWQYQLTDKGLKTVLKFS